ncbi:MAG: PAS domain-containing protein [Desulfobacterales bacterium]|nr:PAS domain-containing protein [Desulfobacterales bacterium]
MGLKTNALFNNFLTSGLKLADIDTLRKVRVLNIFELVFIIVAPLLGLFYLNIGALLLFYICVIAGLTGLGVMLVLRLSKNLTLSSNLTVFVLWAVFIIIRWNSGGMSPQGLILLSWVWNAVLILLAIFLTGYMWGTIWACLVFMESGLSVILFRTGHQFINLIPPEISPVYSMGLYLTGLLAILLFAFLFEKERADANMREQEKSRMIADSRKYMDNIFERLPVPTFVLDISHRVVEWNRACHELTGIAPRDILGKPVWEGFSLDEEGSVADKLLDNPDVLYEKYSESIISMTDSGSFSVEALLPKLKGGMRASIKASPILDEDGNVKGAIQIIQGVQEDNAEPKAGSDHVSPSIEDSGYPAFRVDSKGKIASWNRACERSFGYPESQVLGKNALSLVSKAYRPNFRDTILRVLKGESFKGLEWKYGNSKDKSVYMIVRVQPAPAPSGKVEECVVINTDITALKLRLKNAGRRAIESEEKLKKLTESYTLLTKNIAAIIRKKKKES